MMKMVMMMDAKNERAKERIIRCVASSPGITTITMDANDGKLTVIGDFEIMDVLRKLKKKWRNANLATYGPYDPKKEAESAAAALEKKKEETERQGMQALYWSQHDHQCLYPPWHYHHSTTVYDHHDHYNGCVIV